MADRVEAGGYETLEALGHDLALVAAAALLAELPAVRARKAACHPGGAPFGGTEPALLPPVMPARLWQGRGGRVGLGRKALAWVQVRVPAVPPSRGPIAVPPAPRGPIARL